jgi:hypothetical protein
MIRSAIETFLDRWANLQAWARFLILTLVLAGFGFFAVRPGYRAFKGWRMDQNLRAARQAVTEVRMDDARDLSLSVLRAGDPCIEAFRILERATASLSDPRHGDIARALLTHPAGTVEDRLDGFRGISREVALGVLGQVWSKLPAACQLDPRFATEFAQRLIAERRLGEAAKVLLAVPEAARTPEVDRWLIRVLIDSGKSGGYAEAQRLIAEKLPATVTDISAWLDLLERIPVVSLRAEALAPVRKLLEKPVFGDSARTALMLVRLNYAADFSRRATLLEDAIARWKDRDPEAVARFLVDLGLYQILLDALPPERVAEHPGLLPQLLTASERCSAWPQVVALLDAHGRRMPKVEELAHRAVAAGKMQDPAARVQAWNAAMGEAKSKPTATALLMLSRLAGDAGMPDEAGQAMVEAIRLERGPLPLYADLKPLLNMLAGQGRENSLLEICTTYLAFEPGNPVLLTQYAYLACLHNLVAPGTILKAMKVLAKAFPKELPIQCVLATAYLCDGQYDKAAITLDRLPADPSRLAPGYRAVFLTTQVLNRRVAKDDVRVTQFPWQSLLPSERMKFGELIRVSKP